MSAQEQVDAEKLIQHLQSVIGNQVVEIAKAQLIIDQKNYTIRAQELVIDEYERRFGDLPSELEPREVGSTNGQKEKVQ